MDTNSSQNRSVAKGPIRFESEAALEAFIEKSSRPRVRMSVEGFNPFRPADEIKRELVNHFSSCGDEFRVNVPTDPIVDRRAFVILRGHGAEEKALQLNGSVIGDWNAIVKVAPEEEEEEYLAVSYYRGSLINALLNDRRFMFGVAVSGYDTSLPEDEVERALRAHFSSCGEITHVYICTGDERANIYFSQEEGEALALGLHGSEVGGFKITTSHLATVRPNRPAPCKGYTIPAHMIEFRPEIRRKVMAFKKIKRTLKRVTALRKAFRNARREEKEMMMRPILSQKD
ncbi:unnamed protein product [Eruca vesicaria subsp. sativa]|uniref:RRM domain-containing protein n=1 Tax=Eruca vesicaria subsp. sativa TaxID=29727 RepID=A0ABC8LV87_ERUVS|nr:unnamed protein product [Eruca vesicaria subsp. sativa]